jgi:hypothetical protein
VLNLNRFLRLRAQFQQLWLKCDLRLSNCELRVRNEL